jgi:hypothetical protein
MKAFPVRSQLRSSGVCKGPQFRGLAVVVLAVGLAFSAPGCVSPSFRKAWQSADASMSAQRWEGRWESYVNGHQGPLRAVLSPGEGERVRAQFEAGWKCFVSVFDVSLEVRRRGKTVRLTGEHDLKSCVGGGVYHYRGEVKGDVLWTEYRSARDHGFFELRRLSCTCEDPTAP